MDSVPKFSLKNIVFAKHMDGILWAGKIIKVIPQHKIYQVSFFNDPFVGYFEEANLIPFATDMAKKQKRTIITKNKEQKLLQKMRVKIFKGIQLALQQMWTEQEETGQDQFRQEEQKMQHGFIQKSRQLTLESSFQTAKKRRNVASMGSEEKEPTKRQKLDHGEQSLHGFHEEKVEIHHQQAFGSNLNWQSYSGEYVGQNLCLRISEYKQNKEEMKMAQWKYPEKDVQVYQEMHVKESVVDYKKQEQNIVEVPSITAETCVNTSDENQDFSTAKQAELEAYVNNGNENQAHAEAIEDKCQENEQQIKPVQNREERVQHQCSINSIREEIVQKQYKSCEVSLQIVENPNKPPLQSEIARLANESLKKAEQIKDCQNQGQNQHMRAQCAPVDVEQHSQNSNPNSEEKEAMPIISKLQDQQDHFDNKINLIQSPFGNEDEYQPVQSQIAHQINKLDPNNCRNQGPQLFQISGGKQQDQVIIISDSQAQAEEQSPQTYPVNPVNNQTIVPANNQTIVAANKQEIVINADRQSQPQIFIPFEDEFEDDSQIQQPISIFELRKVPQIEIKPVAQPSQQDDAQLQQPPLMQKAQPVNTIFQSQSIPQLQPEAYQLPEIITNNELPDAQEVPAIVNNQPEATSESLDYEAIRQHLQHKHESLIIPIAEQPQEEDEQQDAHPYQHHSEQPDAYEQGERMEMEIEDPLEQASIGKLSKLSVDFKINIEEERSESEPEGISNPLFQILQKKVNWQTQFGNIEALYKQQFVSPHNYPSLIKALPALRKKMKELPEPLLAQVVKQYLSRIIAYLSAKTQEQAALLSFLQKHIFLASLTSQGLSPETVFQEGILDEFERVVTLYEQGSMRKSWVSNYLAEYLMVKAKLDYFSYQYRQTHIFNEEYEPRLYHNMAYA